jgi:hypothetical protein
MANLLQSSQDKTTTAPSYYTDYLTNIATAGKDAVAGANYVGAQPLQQQAFTDIANTSGTGLPAITAGQGVVNQAAGTDITGAAAPYLQAGTSQSALTAAQPLINSATNLNLGSVAQDYMSPYLRSAVQNVSDIGQRNIMQNLSPMATAAAVGSGQYGSQRGAQVLGQVQNQAQNDLANQIAQMENAGYTSALNAAGVKQGALNTLAGTTVTGQTAQNQANLTAGQTAANAASNEAQALNTAGTNLGALGTQESATNLANINALATLGGQQQTIGQNEQNYPLSKLTGLSDLLKGYTVPTNTSTTMNTSPLSALATIGSGAMGLLQPNAAGVAPITGMLNTLKSMFTSPSGGTGGNIPADIQDAIDTVDAGGTLTPEQLARVYANFGLDSTGQPISSGAVGGGGGALPDGAGGGYNEGVIPGDSGGGGGAAGGGGGATTTPVDDTSSVATSSPVDMSTPEDIPLGGLFADEQTPYAKGGHVKHKNYGALPSRRI